jgi:hypothetical protein
MADLRALRRALLELHRELLAAQRIETERFGGRMSAAETLQAAADDLRFSWLRAVSELIADIDEAFAAAEPDAPDADVEGSLVGRARALLAPPDPGTAFGTRYLRALQEHPAVVLAHRDVTAALAPEV